RADRMQGLEVDRKEAPDGKGRECVDDAWIHCSMRCAGGRARTIGSFAAACLPVDRKAFRKEWKPDFSRRAGFGSSGDRTPSAPPPPPLPRLAACPTHPRGRCRTKPKTTKAVRRAVIAWPAPCGRALHPRRHYRSLMNNHNVHQNFFHILLFVVTLALAWVLLP